jgi:phage terminase Nu1 subunit (DNA packaging protein)
MKRLDDEPNGPPWTGAGYDAVRFGKWLRNLWQKQAGVGANGETYDYESERARLTKAQADKAELESAELRGEMVRADDLIEEWGRMVGSLRSRLLSIPSKTAPVSRAATTDEEAKTLIEAEIIEALEELSSDGLTERARTRQDRVRRNTEASSTSDGEYVGGREPETEPGKQRRARKVANR